MEYIAQLARQLIAFVSPNDVSKRRRLMLSASVLGRELARLDPRDFLPEARLDFINASVDLDTIVQTWSGRMGDFLNLQPEADERVSAEITDVAKRVIAVLERYGGEGWRTKTRPFGFIKDKKLRQIIERDYKELSLVLFPGGAWKSTVIMAGSILEAILFDQLCPTRVRMQALKSTVAPPNKALEDWHLDHLIKVAVDVKLIPQDRADTFDQVLRDYRNFVHPKKEVRAQHSCREGEAQLAFGGLNAICDILQGA